MEDQTIYQAYLMMRTEPSCAELTLAGALALQDRIPLIHAEAPEPSDFHDLGFLLLAEGRDLFDEFVRELLEFFFTVLQVVFRDQLLFLKIPHIVVGVAADVADGHAGLFQAGVNLLGQLVAAILRERWEI